MRRWRGTTRRSGCSSRAGRSRRRRRGNGAKPTLLTPEMLARLQERVRTPPEDGGVWTSGKVAAFLAAELGLASVAPQRGWEALRAIGWTIQRPRPRHATPRRRRPTSGQRSKKARRGRRGGAGPPPRGGGRDVRHRRAPHRAEADPAPRLGAPRRTPPPPSHAKRARDAAASSFSCSTTPAGTPSRTSPCPKASGSSSCPPGSSPGQALHSRAAARRNPLDPLRRADRQQALRDPRRSRCRRRRTMRRPQQGSRTREGASRIPLVAAANFSDLINRSSYKIELGRGQARVKGRVQKAGVTPRAGRG